MIRSVLFAEEASRDLDEIYDFVAERFGERRAQAAVDELYKHCLRFDLFPQRGRMRGDVEPGLRTVGYRRLATIALRVEPGQVTIVRIFANGRDIRI